MNPAMETFTTSLCPVVFHAMYQRVYSLVNQLQIEEFELELTDIAMCSEMYDPVEAVDRFNTKMFNYLNEVLHQHDIVLSDNGTLEDAITLCEAVLLMQDWEDHESILRIIESLSSNEEKFAEVVYMTTTKSLEYVLTIVDSVSDAFIAKLQEFHSKEIQDDTSNATENEALLSQLKIANKFYQGNAVIFKMIGGGLPIGASLEFYLNIYKPFFAQIAKEEMAKELHCVLLAAEDSYDSVVQNFGKVCDMVYDDLNDITRLNTELTRESQKFNTFKLAYTAPSL